MKRTAGLMPAAILTVCLLWLSLAGAWTISGFVYIDDTTPAPCVPVHFYDNEDPDCEGEWMGWTETAANGYYEYTLPPATDTVWIQACLHLWPCLWCSDWEDCVADTICKRATSIDTTSGVSFDFEQPDCECK